MKRLILTAFAGVLFGAAAASAASIQFTFTHPQASYSKTFDVPNGHMARLMAASKEKYGQIGNGVFDQNGVEGKRDRTNQEALAALVADMVGNMRGLVQHVEWEAARKAALSNLGRSPIDIEAR